MDEIERDFLTKLARKSLGRASDEVCVRCPGDENRPAMDWVLPIGADPTDPTHYYPMCRKHHIQLNIAQGRRPRASQAARDLAAAKARERKYLRSQGMSNLYSAWPNDAREAAAERARRRWADPEFREETSRKISEGRARRKELQRNFEATQRERERTGWTDVNAVWRAARANGGRLPAPESNPNPSSETRNDQVR